MKAETNIEICIKLKTVGFPQEPIEPLFAPGSYWVNAWLHTGIMEDDEYEQWTWTDVDMTIGARRYSYYQPTLDELLAWCEEQGWEYDMQHNSNRYYAVLYSSTNNDVVQISDTQSPESLWHALALAILKAKGATE